MQVWNSIREALELALRKILQLLRSQVSRTPSKAKMIQNVLESHLNVHIVVRLDRTFP